MRDKKESRDFYLKIRKCITEREKEKFDRIIFTSFINSRFFKNSDTFLVYISVNNEVGTSDLILYLLENDKKVAVPFCKDKIMEFYYINSPDDLITGRFGIPSVDTDKAEKAENFDNALCIVPAVSFDNNGNRLGYGGGYYDRFLSENDIPTVGLCYQRCVSEALPTEETDIKIDYVLTDSHLWNHKNKEVSAYG